MFGSPQVRGRLYFLSIPAQESKSDEECRQEVIATMDLLCGMMITPVDGYLYDETDPAVTNYYDSLLSHASSGSASAGKRLRSFDWPVVHMQRFREAGLEWCRCTGPDVETLRLFPGLLDLQPREQDILHLHGIGFALETATRTIELKSIVDRGEIPRFGAESVTTVRPGMRKFITSRCRLVRGVEALRLQEIWFPATFAPLLAEMPDRLLCDLAGNAFDLNCYAAILVVGIVALSSGAVRRRRDRRFAVDEEVSEASSGFESDSLWPNEAGLSDGVWEEHL